MKKLPQPLAGTDPALRGLRGRTDGDETTPSRRPPPASSPSGGIHGGCYAWAVGREADMVRPGRVSLVALRVSPMPANCGNALDAGVTDRRTTGRRRSHYEGAGRAARPRDILVAPRRRGESWRGLAQPNDGRSPPWWRTRGGVIASGHSMSGILPYQGRLCRWIAYLHAHAWPPHSLKGDACGRSSVPMLRGWVDGVSDAPNRCPRPLAGLRGLASQKGTVCRPAPRADASSRHDSPTFNRAFASFRSGQWIREQEVVELVDELA
jgi:hypothetical protein